MTTFQKKTQEVSLRISLLIYLWHKMDCVEYKYLFWYTFELQLTVFNVVPWLSTVPGIIAGGVLTRRLQSDGYSISYTRKVVEGICMITEAFCLFLIGKYIFFCSILSIMFNMLNRYKTYKTQNQFNHRAKYILHPRLDFIGYVSIWERVSQ